MNEKVIIKSQPYHPFIIACIPFVVILLVMIEFGSGWYEEIQLGVVFGAALLSLVTFYWLGTTELTVTDKRVTGKATFAKRVDLPLDSISAVGTSALWGIDVGTSSGRIHFKLIRNKDEIHSELGKLLMERQRNEAKSVNVENVTSASNADELKKFKGLLDEGVITQEEFDSKKNQLLGM